MLKLIAKMLSQNVPKIDTENIKGILNQDIKSISIWRIKNILSPLGTILLYDIKKSVAEREILQQYLTDLEVGLV